MVGLVNLFLYILKHPSLSTTASDIAILDIVVGHFGHLEVATCSELSYPFAREVAAIAYKTVRKAKIPSTGSSTMPADKITRLSNMDISNVGASQEVCCILYFPLSFLLAVTAFQPTLQAENSGVATFQRKPVTGQTAFSDETTIWNRS